MQARDKYCPAERPNRDQLFFKSQPAFSSRTAAQDMRMSARAESPTSGSPQMASQVLSGTIPALMTPCGPDRRPDFDALVKMGKHLVGAGMSGLVYCGSMGDWPLLTI